MENHAVRVMLGIRAFLLEHRLTDAEVADLFTGRATMNQIREKRGLPPAEDDLSGQRLLVEPYTYADILGEPLAEAVIRDIEASAADIGRDAVEKLRKLSAVNRKGFLDWKRRQNFA